MAASKAYLVVTDQTNALKRDNGPNRHRRPRHGAGLGGGIVAIAQ